MKYAIISDIHSNLEAFTTVIEWCKSSGIEEYICVGDIVGYNANPVECIELARSLDFDMRVRGNHDEYAGSDVELLGFNPFAKAAIQWTRSLLDEEQKKWLIKSKLKEVDPKNSITIVHATLDSPASWGYIFDNHHAIDNFSYQYTKLCFCGHSHVPVLFQKLANGTRDLGESVQSIPEWERITHQEDISEIKINIDSSSKYLVNIGSVGQPRNGDSRASFVVLDTYLKTITRICLKYDVKAAQSKIISAGLPEVLAGRLELGC